MKSPWGVLEGNGELRYENLSPDMLQLVPISYQRALLEAMEEGNAAEAGQRFFEAWGVGKEEAHERGQFLYQTVRIQASSSALK